MFVSLALLVVYAIVSLVFKSRSLEISPTWMPHGSFNSGSFSSKLVLAVWIVPVVLGVALSQSATEGDVGVALLSLITVVLLCGLLSGLVEKATEAAAAPRIAPPPVPTTNTAETSLVETKRQGGLPLDAKPIAPGLHFTNMQASPEDIVHHVPRPVADRILQELDQSRKKAEQIVASNTTLSSEAQHLKETIADLEKKFHDAEQALNELSRINQNLRSKSSNNEKPFAQMNVEEIEKAREAREREIRTLDELKRSKVQAQKTGG